MKRFIKNKRIDRLTFLYFGTLPLVALALIQSYAIHTNASQTNEAFIAVAGLAALVIVPFIVAATMKRLRDLGRSPWWTPLVLIGLVTAYVWVLVFMYLQFYKLNDTSSS